MINLKIDKTISGFCPTLNADNSITITYEVIEEFGKSPKFIQVGADCECASYGNCPIMTECPIRAKAPKSLSSD